jgi:hypothetical protein
MRVVEISKPTSWGPAVMKRREDEMKAEGQV